LAGVILGFTALSACLRRTGPKFVTGNGTMSSSLFWVQTRQNPAQQGFSNFLAGEQRKAITTLTSDHEVICGLA
jgi:hypothetical protein